MGDLNSKLQQIRTDYKTRVLIETTALSDPFQQFETWFSQAIEAEVLEVNAFSLSTISATGKPSSRIVLLRSVSDKGFTFYTNYNSHKGISLIQHPHTALNFFWPELERQIRIEGTAAKVSEEESDNYFNSRPRESQIGAWASGQSTVLKSRDELENTVKFYEEKYKDQPVPRPPHWGGFVIVPTYFEFWQGRASRLHDRISYSLQSGNTWKMERLAP